jgi:hypothetical protein
MVSLQIPQQGIYLSEMPAVGELGIAHTYCPTRALCTTKLFLRNWSHHVSQRQSVSCGVTFVLSISGSNQPDCQQLH